jgi:GxxExxY protein
MNADEHRLTEEAMHALAYELRRTGINVKQQEPIAVYYDGLVVGDYFADLLVGDATIVELKATKGTP